MPYNASRTGATALTSTSSALRWHVCHTKPRCEKKFAALMEVEDFNYYLPLIESVRAYGRQTKRFTKPLFPGYVFVHLPVAEKNRIYQQDLLARAFAVEDEARFIQQLDDVRAIVASGLALSVHPLLKRGSAVKVIGGPLHGLEGTIDDPLDPQGIVVAIDVLQQGLLVKLPLESLRPLP
jgi:transcriptional antiterminator RfaH